MRVRDYEYSELEYENDIGKQRMDELILKVKQTYYKKDNTIPLFKLLEIAKNDDEYNFLFDWTTENDIKIRGKNGTLSDMGFNYEELVEHSNNLKDTISAEEQNEYFEKIGEGDREARKEFIERNMRLALWVANSRGINRLNIPQKEKQSFAYEGLIRAVDKFDYTRGFRFSTYAVKTIFRTITRRYAEMQKEKYGNISYQNVEVVDKIKAVENEFLAKGEKPSISDIAAIMEMDEDKVEYIKQLMDDYDTESLESIVEDRYDNEEWIENLHDSDNLEESPSGYILDGVYYEPERETLEIENVSGESVYDYDVENIVDDKMKNELIDTVLDTLTKREKRVIKERFGLENGEAKTLEDVAVGLDVTHERIRQIEAKALRKLRHPSRFKNLKMFVVPNSSKMLISKKIRPETDSFIVSSVKEESEIDIKSDLTEENSHEKKLNDENGTQLKFDFSTDENKESIISNNSDKGSDNYNLDGDLYSYEQEGEFDEFGQGEDLDGFEQSGSFDDFFDEVEEKPFYEIDEATDDLYNDENELAGVDNGVDIEMKTEEQLPEEENIQNKEHIDEENVTESKTESLEDELTDAIHSLKSAYMELQKQKELNNEMQVQLRNELNKLKSENLSLEERISKLDKIVNGEDAAFLKEIGELDSLLAKKQQAEKELQEKKEKEQQMKSEVEKLDNQNQELEEQTVEIKNNIRDMFKEL